MTNVANNFDSMSFLSETINWQIDIMFFMAHYEVQAKMSKMLHPPNNMDSVFFLNTESFSYYLFGTFINFADQKQLKSVFCDFNVEMSKMEDLRAADPVMEQNMRGRPTCLEQVPNTQILLQTQVHFWFFCCLLHPLVSPINGTFSGCLVNNPLCLF